MKNTKSNEMFKRLHPGQKQISARGYNDLCRAVEDMQGNLTSMGVIDLTTVWAKNKTGAALAPFNIVALKQSIWDQEDNYSDFRSSILFEGHLPTPNTENLTPLKGTDYEGRWGIVLQACAIDGYANVKHSGIVQCQVNVTNEDHEWAEVAQDDAEKLESGFEGSAKILDKEDGEGAKWALLLLNAHNMGMSDDPLTDLTDGWKQREQEEKSGVKFNLVIAGDGYVPGENESLKGVQFDSFGHLVEVGDGIEESSSNSSVTGSSVSDSSDSSVSDSSDSSFERAFPSEDIEPDCAVCEYDYVMINFSVTGGCSFGGLNATYVLEHIGNCEYRYTINAEENAYVALKINTTSTEMIQYIRHNDTYNGRGANFEWTPDSKYCNDTFVTEYTYKECTITAEVLGWR